MKKNNYPGKFIVIEGLDGSGQSTQVGLLKDFFIKKGYQVLKTKEPTLNSEAGKMIRKVLDKEKKISLKKIQILFAEDRKKHLEKEIIPALKKGKIVVSDRYFFSSFAYGVASRLSLDWLIEINKEFLMPNVVFFLNTTPKTCVERIKKRGDRVTLFEKEKKLNEVYKIYKDLIEKFENIQPINGEKNIKEVFFEIKKFL